MKKLVIIFVAVMFAASTAFAYDNLITNDTSAVQGAATMKAEAAVVYTSASKCFDKDSESVDYADDMTGLQIPIKFRYGVMDKLEAFGVLGVLNKWDQGDFGESGVGDLWLGAKYSVMPEGLFTVRGAVLIPLGDDEKGLGNAGGFGIDVAAMTAKQMDAIGLNGQVGVRYAAEDSDTKIQPGFGIYIDGEGSYAISEALKAQLGIEVMTTGDSKVDGNDAKDTGTMSIELNVGGAYTLAENMALKADVLYNLAGTNTDQYFGVLVAFQYGF